MLIKYGLLHLGPWCLASTMREGAQGAAGGAAGVRGCGRRPEQGGQATESSPRCLNGRYHAEEVRDSRIDGELGWQRCAHKCVTRRRGKGKVQCRVSRREKGGVGHATEARRGGAS